MFLYHGSNVEIKEIDLTLSKPNKDFGRGFYLSNNYEQSYEMATFKTTFFRGSPLVTKFEFDESLFSIFFRHPKSDSNACKQRTLP